MERFNSLDDFNEACSLSHHNDDLYNLFVGEMICDDSGFECVVVYADNDNAIQECYMYTKENVYTLEFVMTIQKGMEMLADVVTMSPRNPDC